MWTKRLSLWKTEGNELADRLADDAHEGFPKHIMELANLYVHRTNQYRELVHIIQLTILRVIEAMQVGKATYANLLSPEVAPNIKGHRRRQMLPKHIAYPHYFNANKGKAEESRRSDCSNIARKWPHFTFLNEAKNFIANLAVTKPVHHEHGISWLELAVLFEYRTSILIPNDLGNQDKQGYLFPKPVAFKRVVQIATIASKRILDAMVVPRAVKPLWLTNAALGQRFRNLGSLSSTATVGFTVGITQDEQHFLQVNVLRLHDLKGGKLFDQLKTARLWSTRRHINVRQTRPYTIQSVSQRHSSHSTLYAIPIAYLTR